MDERAHRVVVVEHFFVDPRTCVGEEAHGRAVGEVVPVEDLVKKMRGRPLGERLARLYGVPQKSAMTVFPKFGDWNVVPHMKLPWLREGGQGAEYPCTRYMVVDGAGARNWFMLWVAVDAAGVWWVYREWPDVAGVGEWILPGPKPMGKSCW